MKLPRFQYSLRTVFVALTVLAVPCWYVGWQYQIVQHRKELQAKAEKTAVFIDIHFDDSPTLPWVRRSFGDEPINLIILREGMQDSDVQAIKNAFPESNFDAVGSCITEKMHPAH